MMVNADSYVGTTQDFEGRPPFTHVYHGDYLGVIAWPVPGQDVCAWRIMDLSSGDTLDQGRAWSEEVAWLCMNTTVLDRIRAVNAA